MIIHQKFKSLNCFEAGVLPFYLCDPTLKYVLDFLTVLITYLDMAIKVVFAILAALTHSFTSTYCKICLMLLQIWQLERYGANISLDVVELHLTIV